MAETNDELAWLQTQIEEREWARPRLERAKEIFKKGVVVTFYRFLTFFVRLLIGVLGALCLP